MRALLAVLMLALLASSSLAPVTLAQSSTDEAEARALRAAVAPMQVVFDTAPLVVGRAIDEATRDGTPDDAIGLLDQLETFTARMSENLVLSPLATHREATLAAAPHARALVIALARVPEDVAHLATSAARCADEQPTQAEIEALLAARFAAGSTGRELQTIAREAPPGIDARELLSAGSRLEAWSNTFESFAECGVLDDEADDVPLLSLTLTPELAWPTREVSVRGVSNQPGLVLVRVPALGLMVELEPVAGRFEHEFAIPADAPLGSATINASTADLTASATLTITRAPSTLTLVGPARVAAGSNATFFLELRSPIPNGTDDATVLMGGTPIRLTDGRAIHAVRAPDREARLDFVFTYEGTPLVESTTAKAKLVVFAPETTAVQGQATVAWQPVPVAAALVAGILILGLLWHLRRRTRVSNAARTDAVDAKARLPNEAPDTRGLSIVPLVTLLATALRRLGLARESTTAREMRPLLERFGVDAREIIDDFERVRYGSCHEDASWTERARTWFRTTWERIRGADHS